MRIEWGGGAGPCVPACPDYEDDQGNPEYPGDRGPNDPSSPGGGYGGTSPGGGGGDGVPRGRVPRPHFPDFSYRPNPPFVRVSLGQRSTTIGQFIWTFSGDAKYGLGSYGWTLTRTGRMDLALRLGRQAEGLIMSADTGTSGDVQLSVGRARTVGATVSIVSTSAGAQGPHRLPYTRTTYVATTKNMTITYSHTIEFRPPQGVGGPQPVGIRVPDFQYQPFSARDLFFAAGLAFVAVTAGAVILSASAG